MGYGINTYGVRQGRYCVTNAPPLVSSPRIDFSDRELLQQALVLYGEHNVSFIDAYHTALGRRAGHEAIYSYDRDFERLKFPRLEP